jgi:translation initiation factor 3 subunit A
MYWTRPTTRSEDSIHQRERDRESQRETERDRERERESERETERDRERERERDRERQRERECGRWTSRSVCWEAATPVSFSEVSECCHLERPL